MEDPIKKIVERMAELRPIIMDLGAKDTLDDEQRSTWAASVTEMDALTETKADMEDRQARAQAAAAVLPDDFGKDRGQDALTLAVRDMQAIPGPEARAKAMDLVERSHAYTSDDHKESVVRLMERGGSVGDFVARHALATSSEAYRDAWMLYLSGRTQGPHIELLERAMSARAMTAGTGSSGGYFVPLYLDPTMILTGAGTFNMIRQRADVRQINTMVFNGVSAAQISSGEIAENVAFSDNSPTATQIQSTMLKAGCYIPASFEAFEDIEGLANDVGRLIADSKDNYEANRLTVGLGTTQPTGVVTGVTAITSSRVSPAMGGTFVVGDVYSVHQSLPPRYRRSAGGSRAWMASVNTINAMRQFATANVYHAFLVDLAGGQPPNLIGDPLDEASDMATAITTGNNLLLYGDFSRFMIIDRIGLTTEFIPNVFASTGLPTGTRAWLAHWRWNTALADANAFRLLKL